MSKWRVEKYTSWRTTSPWRVVNQHGVIADYFPTHRMAIGYADSMVRTLKEERMTNIDRAVRVLNEHWSVAQESGQADEAECCVQALADAGLLAPDLPPKDEWDLVTLIPREGRATLIKDIFTDTSYSIAGARKHALDMRAAASHAEKEESNE